MPAGPRWTATAGMRLEATKHARGSCSTNTTRRTARLIRPRCRHVPGDLHQKKIHDVTGRRCPRAPPEARQWAAGRRGPLPLLPEDSAPFLFTGFLSSRVSALFAAPTPCARTRTHTYTRRHVPARRPIDGCAAMCLSPLAEKRLPRRCTVCPSRQAIADFWRWFCTHAGHSRGRCGAIYARSGTHPLAEVTVGPASFR